MRSPLLCCIPWAILLASCGLVPRGEGVICSDDATHFALAASTTKVACVTDPFGHATTLDSLGFDAYAPEQLGSPPGDTGALTFNHFDDRINLTVSCSAAELASSSGTMTCYEFSSPPGLPPDYQPAPDYNDVSVSRETLFAVSVVRTSGPLFASDKPKRGDTVRAEMTISGTTASGFRLDQCKLTIAAQWTAQQDCHMTSM